MSKKISYAVRDFASLRQELVNLTKEYYPDLISNFNDSSIYSVLLDINAAVSDNLHYHIDRVWQETMLDFAQQKQSLYHISKTYGIKLPGLRPSVALCDFSINIPLSKTHGDSEDSRYEGILRSGAQISGGGQIFETIDDIDFASPFNSRGEPNWTKVPNRDANGTTISYTITKREAVVNGSSRIYRKVITELDQKPFLKIYLPEQNVLGVVDVIHKDGTNYGDNPTYDEFLKSANKWYEVPSLVEDKVFVENTTTVSDTYNFTAGDFIKVDNKFITEYTPEGYFLLTFGSGNVQPMENLDNYMTSTMKVNLSTFLNNLSLGNMLKANTTLFIKYRIGGGKDSNVGINVITSVDNVDFVISSALDKSTADQVTRSLRVTNVTPAVGGSDAPSIEEIRNMIAYNFAAQNRAVTLYDYKSLIETMPSTYGAPAKVNVLESDNKILIKLLSYDDKGNLSNIVSSVLQNNIKNYLSKFKMILDKLEITCGEVVDLRMEVDLFIDKNATQTDVTQKVIQTITDETSVDKRKMGDPFFVGDLMGKIGNVAGVVNVIDIRVYNKIGNGYSTAEVHQTYTNDNTKEINIAGDMVIYMLPEQIYQIRYPNKDIAIRVKTMSSPSY